MWTITLQVSRAPLQREKTSLDSAMEATIDNEKNDNGGCFADAELV